MKKLLIVLAAAGFGTLLGGWVATNPFRTESSSAAFDLAGDQADSVRFTLLRYEGSPESTLDGDILYCGVGLRSEPYVLDVAVSSPPSLIEGGVPSGSHERAGWLDVNLQGSRLGAPFSDSTEYNVARNDSFSFRLTLGGRPGRDQLVSISSPPKGDPSGAGQSFTGFASVRAREDAVDPFVGDGRNDDYCVTIGPNGEFAQGAIATRLPVPDPWVVDGNGADGGVLVDLAHLYPGP